MFDWKTTVIWHLSRLMYTPSYFFSLICSLIKPTLWLVWHMHMHNSHTHQSHSPSNPQEEFLLKNTQIKRPFHILSQDYALVVVEACISNVWACLIHKRLLIKDSKTEFLIIGSSHQLPKISIDSITVADSTIQPLASVCNLGSWFDTTMSMSVHTGKICSKAFSDLYRIWQKTKDN